MINRNQLTVGAFIRDAQTNRLYEVVDISDDRSKIELEDALSPIDQPHRRTVLLGYNTMSMTLVRPARTLGELIDVRDVATEGQW